MSHQRLFLLIVVAAFSFAGCGESGQPKSEIAGGISPQLPATASPQAAAEPALTARTGDVQVADQAVEKEAVLARIVSELPQGDDFDPDTVTLVPLDLSEAGLDLTIDAPPGSTVKKSWTSGDALIENPVLKRFHLAVGPGRVSPQAARSIWLAASRDSTVGEVVRETADAFVARLDALLGGKDYVMAATKTFGHVDLFAMTARETVEGRGSVLLPKSIALLQLRCAQTLRPNEHFDRVDSLDALIGRGLLQASTERDEPATRESTAALAKHNAKLTDSMLSFLKEMPNLESLDLSSCRISAAGIDALRELAGLKSLRLKNPLLTDYDGALKIPDLVRITGLPKLEELGLAFFRLNTGDGALLGEFVKIKRLDLSFSRVGKEALEALARLPALESLKMQSAHLDDTMIPQLSALKNLKQLDVLSNDLTPDGFEQLRKALPDGVLVTN